jgi:hypothetical protein
MVHVASFLSVEDVTAVSAACTFTSGGQFGRSEAVWKVLFGRDFPNSKSSGACCPGWRAAYLNQLFGVRLGLGPAAARHKPLLRTLEHLLLQVAPQTQLCMQDLTVILVQGPAVQQTALAQQVQNKRALPAAAADALAALQSNSAVASASCQPRPSSMLLGFTTGNAAHRDALELVLKRVSNRMKPPAWSTVVGLAPNSRICALPDYPGPQPVNVALPSALPSYELPGVAAANLRPPRVQ